MRSVPEWIGRSDDVAIPKRVRLRIFSRCEGRCGLTGAKIKVGDAYEFDHIKPLWADGEHRETNLHPVLKAAHARKSADDQTIKAKADRIRFKHITPRADWPRSQTIKSAGFKSRWARRRASTETTGAW